MERPRRRAAVRSKTIKRTADPAYYLGYVDDEESPQAIMAKFAAVDRIVAKAKRKQAAAASSSTPGDGSVSPTLVDIESISAPEYETEAGVSASEAPTEASESEHTGLDTRTMAKLLKATASVSVKRARAQVDAVDMALWNMGIDTDETSWLYDEPISESDDDEYNQLDQEAFFADTPPQAGPKAKKARTAQAGKARLPVASRSAEDAADAASTEWSSKRGASATAAAVAATDRGSRRSRTSKRSKASGKRKKKPPSLLDENGDITAAAAVAAAKASAGKLSRSVLAAAASSTSAASRPGVRRSRSKTAAAATSATAGAGKPTNRKARERIELALANADAGRFLFLKRSVSTADRRLEPECTRIPPQPIPRSWTRHVVPYAPVLPTVGSVPGAAYHVVPCVLDVAINKLGPLFEGVYLDPPYDAPEPYRVSVQDLRRLQLGRDVMPKGLLFVWTRKTEIYDMVQVMKHHEFVYVENLSWVMLGVNNLLNRAPSDVFNISKMTLLIFKRVGVKTETESDIVPIKHQRSADCILGFVARETSPLGRFIKPRTVFDTIETMMFRSGFDQDKGRGLFLHLWGSRGDVRSGWTTVERATPAVQPCVISSIPASALSPPPALAPADASQPVADPAAVPIARSLLPPQLPALTSRPPVQSASDVAPVLASSLAAAVDPAAPPGVTDAALA